MALIFNQFLKVVIVLLAISKCALADLSRCPAGLPRDKFLKTFGENCFRFINSELYWGEARDACARTSNGHHVVIKDMETHRFLIKSMNELEWTNNGVWIGLYESGGQWKWVTGESVSWSNWDNSEPNNGALFKEDCALLRRDDGKWHDYPCERLSWKYKSICQYNMSPMTTSTQSVTTTTTEIGPLNQTAIITKSDVAERSKTEGLIIGEGILAGIIGGTSIIGLLILIIVIVYCIKIKRKNKSDTMFNNVTYAARNAPSENIENQTFGNQTLPGSRYEDFPANEDSTDNVNETDPDSMYAMPQRKEKDREGYLTPYYCAKYADTDGASAKYVNVDSVDCNDSIYEEPQDVNYYDTIDKSRKESKNEYQSIQNTNSYMFMNDNSKTDYVLPS